MPVPFRSGFRRVVRRRDPVAGVLFDSRTALIGVAAASATAFVALSAVVAGTDDAFGAEVPVRAAMKGALPKAVLSPAVRLGDPSTLAVALTATSVLAWRWRRKDLAAVVASSAAAAAAIPTVLKPVIGRTKGGYLAFPSGHTTGSLLTAALIAAAVAAAPGASTPVRRAGFTAAAAVAVVGGTAPLFGGWHWPADSVGSVLWCAAALTTALAVVTPTSRTELTALDPA